MIYNDFFKNENTITNHSKKRLDWLELKKNPWNIFSNYERKFDNSLEKIHHLKNEYVKNLIHHQDLTNNIKFDDDKYNNNKLKLDDYFSIFFSTITFTSIILIFLTFFCLTFNIPMVRILDSIHFFFFHLFSISVLLSTFNIKNHNKDNYLDKNLYMKNSLTDIEDKLNNLKQKYKKEAKKLLHNREELNIREELDTQYHTDIPELHTAIQNILEKYYPRESFTSITTDIEKDSKQYLKFPDIKHISKISKFINKIIDDQISLNIGNKMNENLNNYKTDNNQSPSTLIAVANGN